MKREPFRQGQLDGLCGIYAVINALKLIVRISHNEGSDLLYEAVLTLEKKKPASVYITTGISVVDLSIILRDIICPQYDLIRTKPFHRRAKVSIDEYWDTLTGFLNSDEPRSVIIVIETSKWGHWTVVKEITSKQMILNDSDGRKVVNRRHCSTTELNSETPVLIYPSQTFFLRPND
ncbi:MAG: hypothetical protein PF442_10705 [Desulfobulbaceae bacterium]|jgi:hypothetical protein|nr:hypothetical protein [Desulfobulbaceae bacterium]